MLSRRFYFIIFILLFFNEAANSRNKKIGGNDLTITPNKIDTVLNITPPLYNFYSKYLNCNGIAIRSSGVVKNKALIIASGKIKLLLRQMPEVSSNLIRNGVEMHIIGAGQQTSDLPEFKHLKGREYMVDTFKMDFDKRMRGMTGGVFASCGEENLLGLPNDRYAGGYDICMHEFAHVIMNIGFDSIMRTKVEQQFKRAIANGLWKDSYAATDANEYWAELTTWYFGKHGDYLKGKIPKAGPEALHDYDIEGYKLLDSVYLGHIKPNALKTKASVLVTAGIPSGITKNKALLSVVNNKSTPLKLFWIDLQGTARYCKTIASKASFIQNTFIANVWMLRDDKGTPLLYIKVLDPLCELVIKD